MRKRESTKSLVSMVLMSIAIVGMGILGGPVAVHAVNCSDVIARGPDWTDTDGDGFTDYDECQGISLKTGQTLKLDPNVKDVFVILIRATETGATRTNIPANWFEFLSNPMSMGGLGIRVHEVTKDQVESDRTVCLGCSLAIGSQTRQKAVRVTESLDPGTTDQQKKTFGLAEWGTPNGLDDATIWTQRIINYIMSVCGTKYGTSSCRGSSSTSAYGQILNDIYFKHTLAHEIGHMMKLTGKYTSSYGGYHYKAGTGVEMDQAVSVKGTVFNIGTAYKAADQSDPQMGFQLK
jgi:hypothetical protein